MSRAAILPFPGDPFLLHYWLGLFDKYWVDEIDRLYIHLNSPIEAEVVAYIRELCNNHPKIRLMYTSNQLEHGTAIDHILEVVEEELVMLIEDDGFIFKKGIVDTCFKYLESGQYDIVGSKRGSCSIEILEKARMKWGLDYTGIGDQGPNFWPCFFFISKALLLKTDRNFCARAWKRGEKIEPLGFTAVGEIVAADTFVNTSLQLRCLVPEHRIKYMPQYHGAPEDITHFRNKTHLFDGAAPWCHIGSLSTGVGGVLRDDYNRALARRHREPSQGDSILDKVCNTPEEKMEWERRVQWWYTFWQKADPGKLGVFKDLYYLAIMRVIDQYGLSLANIHARQKAYATLGL